MKTAADFRQVAREKLKGKWGNAVLASFVANLLGAGTIFFSSNISSGVGSGLGSAASEFGRIGYLSEEEITAILIGLAVVVGIALIAGMIGLVIRIFLSGASTLGYIKYNQGLIRGDNSERVEDVFSGFGNIIKGAGVQAQRWIFVSLWSMLFLIPGTIKSFSYAMAPYILTENPGLTANQSIKESMKLMDGNKWRLFCLNLSFIGWTLLAIFFTCGIGLLWVRAYQEAAYMDFYEEIKKEKGIYYGTPSEINNEHYYNSIYQYQ